MARSRGLGDVYKRQAVSNMVAKLSILTDSVLNDDGTTHPMTTSIPLRGLSPDALSTGDGHAVTCC
jgi:hypothetical protein